jgi:catechol 2,3-dioxygenase-like lactoylglutathione lyase family enzyme
MPDRLVTHLRHVDLAVPDFDRQLAFYTGTWGLTQVAGDTGLAFLAAEGSPEQYAVRLRQGEKRIDLVALGAKDAAAVDALAEQLIARGNTLVSEPGSLDTPGGGYGFRVFDGDGRTVEISADVALRQHRRIEEGESIPVALSHVVFNSPNPESTVQWYVDNLDFAVSDQLIHPHMGEMMWFLRMNPQHHTIAVARCPHHSLHHASFEMRGIDEYMRGTGRLLRQGVEKIWGPGRHLAGNNTFSYFLDPHGNTIEYTTSLENIDEDIWHPSKFDFTELNVQDQWGTAEVMNEFIASKSFNDPDPGLFVAPPV